MLLSFHGRNYRTYDGIIRAAFRQYPDAVDVACAPNDAGGHTLTIETPTQRYTYRTFPGEPFLRLKEAQHLT